MAEGTFDESLAVDVELEPGEMSLHDVYMIHGARPNTSTQRRTGVALRYMPATSVFHRDLRPAEGKTGVAVNFAKRPLWLVKGVDRTGKNDFSVGHADAWNKESGGRFANINRPIAGPTHERSCPWASIRCSCTRWRRRTA